MRSARTVLLLALFGCDPPEKAAYVDLAREANSILHSMQPTANRLLSLAPSREELNSVSLQRTKAKAIIEACESADEQLWKLRKIDFAREPFTPEGGKASVDEYAGWLLDRRAVYCGHGKESLLTTCAFECYDEWSGLIGEVERLRREAKKYGVALSALRD